MVRLPRASDLEAGADAVARLPVFTLEGLHVSRGHQMNAARAEEWVALAELHTAVRHLCLEPLGLLIEEVLTTAVEAEHRHVVGKDQLAGLEAEVLALGMIRAKQELVAQMRALVIDAAARGESSVPIGHRQPDRVIGVDQVVRDTAQVELCVNSAFGADLY